VLFNQTALNAPLARFTPQTHPRQLQKNKKSKFYNIRHFDEKYNKRTCKKSIVGVKKAEGLFLHLWLSPYFSSRISSISFL